MPSGINAVLRGAGSAFAPGAVSKVKTLLDPAVPKELLADPEEARRARLAARFGTLGSIFGLLYASFYLGIGHRWGALIILICSLAFATASFLMRITRTVSLTGNLLCLVLTLGFTALCCVEGGLEGHAIAWLVSVPLVAFLLVGRSAARRWAVVAFVAAGTVAATSLAGKALPVTYDAKWNSIVSSAGYLGLIAFMYLLGLIFETGRHQAFSKMQAALSELAASNDRLVNLNQEKNEFMGIAAHDLRSPLTVIVGCAELVGNTNDQTRIDELARMIGSAANRMRALISDLLDANAIEEGKFASKIERCDISALVKESVEHNQTTSARKGIEIRLGTSDGLWAKADRAVVLQILDNLISNALKYSPPKTTVYVHTMPEVDYVVMMVRDQGPGISEADQKKMFGKFTRLTARPTGGESSTGLGLSIVKRLTEAMSGNVQCHSILGSGATFSVRLPVWRTQDGNATNPAPKRTTPAPMHAAKASQHQPAAQTAVWVQAP